MFLILMITISLQTTRIGRVHEFKENWKGFNKVPSADMVKKKKKRKKTGNRRNVLVRQMTLAETREFAGSMQTLLFEVLTTDWMRR